MSSSKEVETREASSYEQDQKTRAQIEAIENEIKTQQLLTSDLQPLSNLVKLYNQKDCSINGNSNNNFVKGSEYLCTKYKSWRMIRGDGNCYYRAFLYAVCQELLRGCCTSTSSTNDDENNYKKELTRLQQYVASSIDEVTKYGYDRFTIETFHEELVELFDFITTNITIKSYTELQKEIHTKLNEENSTSDYCTWYLRVITSSHLKADPDRFVHYLDDPNYFDVPTFCSREVDPMGKECGMVQVLALAEAFGIKVNIEYLDGNEMTGLDKKLTLHEFGPDSNAGSCLEINLLYRPGHYDILYI